MKIMNLINVGKIILITLLFCMIGLLFHAYQKEWIILLLPHQTTSYQDKILDAGPHFKQHTITLFYFKNITWHKENSLIIWSSDMALNIKSITNNWLTLLEDEKLIDTDIQLLSAVIAQNKELFLSFNKDLFKPQDSTYGKLMIIHGLLKTIHENKIPIQSIRFLVHHQTLIDDHLNFLISWPITGYMQS